MMLPGVEVARRRRVRAGRGRDRAYDGGVNHSETHRSRLVTTGAHHQQRHGNTPTISRPQPLLRMQENLQEQRSDSSSAAAITSTNNRNATANVADNHDSRPFAHHYRSREETQGSKFSSLWRRHSSCSHSDPSGVAMDARNRLDELLQAAAHATQIKNSSSSSGRNSTSRHYAQSSHPTGLTRLRDHHLEENDRRKGVYTWLATCGLSVKQCLNREVISHRSTSSCDSCTDRSSSSITTTSSRSSGLSNTNAMMKTLPRDDLPANEPDQDDCPVCLEGFLAGETTITLQCSHTFHPHCLTPWLSKHDKCPCCRANVTRHKHDPRERSLLREKDLLSWVEAITQRQRDKESLTPC